MGNAETIKSMYDAFAKGDIPTIVGVMDPKVEWNEAEGILYDQGKPYVGPDEVLQGVFARLAEEWDGFTVTPSNIIDGGDTIVAEARYRGTFKATGKALDAQVAHVFDLRDGKVTRFQQYTDTRQFTEVTGIVGGS